jgi:hypothetical protein
LPIGEHVYEQEFERYWTAFLWSEKDPREIDLSQYKPCLESLSKSDDCSCERSVLSMKQATQMGREQRSEPRFATNTPALLQVLNPFSDECWHVHVLNVSKNGLGLYMAVAPMPGSAVKVRMEDCVAFGNIRYSVRTTDGFLVGVQLHDHILSCTTSRRIRTEAGPGEREIS